MSRDRLPYFRFVGRANLFAVIAAFVLIFLASGTSFADIPGDEDISENIFATELAPVVDYGIFSERFIAVRLKPAPRGMSPIQTPPPENEEEEIFDPKPMKPPERPPVPVDPSFLDQPLACTATVVNASATSGNEDESFMAVNPTNTQNIVVFSNLSASSIHRSYTTNGGTSWTHGTVATGVACCDAQAAWDNFGNLFVVYINGSVNQINVILSTNGGATFGSPVTVGTGSVDQPSIAVGNGSVWVDWNLSGNMVARGAPVTGLGALGAFAAVQTIPSAAGTYGGIAVGPGANGGKVIVTYTSPSGGQGPGTIYTNTDADGLGAGGFGARVTVTTTNVGGFDFIPAQSGRSIDSEPGVVWDATGGTFNNRIYLVYTEEVVAESNDTDIMMRTSTDDGATWSAPVRVNDDATTRSQFLPYLTLDKTTGTVAVGFHDARNDNGTVGTGGTNTTANDDAEYFATYSTNGGTTWAANTRISGGWSNAAAAGASTDYGDYEGQMAQSGKLYAIWADNSNCDGTNPNGTAHQFDLYMGTLTIPGGGATPTVTNTATPTNTPTNTPTSTPTFTPTRTSTNTPTPAATATNTSTATFTATNTPTRTSTNTPTNTATPTFTQTNTATNTPTAANTPTFTATNTATSTPTPLLSVSLPNVTASPGTEVTIPVTVGDTTGLQITSYDFQITFDPTIVQPSASPSDTAGTLSSAMLITPNTSNSGHLIISAFQGNFLAGAGTLINLKFTVVGASGSTPLTFEDYTDPNSLFHPAFQFNEGVPASALTNGSITVVGTVITGSVTYGNSIGSPTPRYVSNATITGTGSPNVTTTTAAPGGPTEGRYYLSGFGGGNYTVAPSKTGSANNISSFDAGRIAQHVAGNTFLTGNQLVVADVSNNGTISSFDAAEIANYVVSGSPAGITGTWKFNPVNLSYASVPSSITGQDYSALLMGEVTGNWTNTGARPVGSRQLTEGSDSFGDGTESIAVAAPHLAAPADSEILIPVSVHGVANKGIIAYEFDLRYDPSVIQPQANPVDVTGTISRGFTAVAKSDEPGLLRVAVYGAMPLDNNGLLLNLRFTAGGASGTVSPLMWERIMFNEGDSLTMTANGQVELSSAVINPAEINGRVITALGLGVPNARVTLTDTDEQTRTAVSNGFGYYRFSGLELGETYTFSVESRGWAFTPITVSVTDEVISVDMIASK